MRAAGASAQPRARCPAVAAASDSARRPHADDAPASPHVGVTTSAAPTTSGSRPSMSSQRSTRSTSACRSAAGASVGRRHDAQRDGLPRLERRRPSTSWPAASTLAEVDRQARGRRRRAAASSGVLGRARVHPRLGALVGDRAEHPAEVLGGLGRVDDAVPAEAGRGRHAAASTAASAGSSTWTTSRSAPRHPTAYVAHVVAHALGQRLGQVAAGAVVAEHLVAAGLLDGGGQGPGPGDLHLERRRCSPGRAPRARRGPGRAGCARAGGRRRRRR